MKVGVWNVVLIWPADLWSGASLDWGIQPGKLIPGEHRTPKLTGGVAVTLDFCTSTSLRVIQTYQSLHVIIYTFFKCDVGSSLENGRMEFGLSGSASGSWSLVEFGGVWWSLVEFGDVWRCLEMSGDVWRCLEMSGDVLDVWRCLETS